MAESTSKKGVDIRSRFKRALMKADNSRETFKSFKAEGAEQITMIRHRFDPVAEKWKEPEEVKCTIEPTPHNTALPGATREIFRMRLFSKLRGCDNYVAKRYREHVEATKEMYFLDCKMQMMAKHVAEQYNKLKPPHRIDFLEAFVLESNIDGTTQYWAAEKFVEGNYEKHSSNSGFVEEAHMRMTPHAFSHFSYVLSGGKRMIVDIQGVGDLWTDPQFHSLSDEEFGIGNMGLTGMAKFFRTYAYNPLCEWIGLVDFERSSAEKMAGVDWNSAAHDWKIEDLLAKKNPQARSFAKLSSRLGGDVHLQLAKLYERGTFGDQVDLDSAFFHVQKAADLGVKEAHVILSKLYAGIPQDYLDGFSVDEDHAKAFGHAREAAKLGDFNAVYTVAQYYDGTMRAEGVEVDYHRALKYYQRLVDEHENIDDEAAGDNEEFEMHKILAKMAQMYDAGGSGLSRSPAKAAVLYNEAAVAAEHHFKAKLAAKYYEKAAELEAELEDDDDDDDESTTPTDTDGNSSAPTSPGPLGPRNAELLLRSPIASAETPTLKPLQVGHQAGWFEGAVVSMIDNFVAYIRNKASAGAPALSEEQERKKAEEFLMAYEQNKHQLDDELAPAQQQSQKVWVLTCVDKAGQAALRDSLRSKHADHIHTQPGCVKLAGLLKDPDGHVTGSHMILRMTEADAKQFLESDPYYVEGLYGSTSLTEWEVEWNTLNVTKAAEKALFFNQFPALNPA